MEPAPGKRSECPIRTLFAQSREQPTGRGCNPTARSQRAAGRKTEMITAPIGRIAPARDTNAPATTGSTGSTGSTSDSSSNAISTAAGGPMGETQFLQLLVSQMQNQDPTAPMDGTQMAAQLAQFSSVEQLINVNAKLDSITSLLTPSTTPAANSAAQGS